MGLKLLRILCSWPHCLSTTQYPYLRMNVSTTLAAVGKRVDAILGPPIFWFVPPPIIILPSSSRVLLRSVIWGHLLHRQSTDFFPFPAKDACECCSLARRKPFEQFRPCMTLSIKTLLHGCTMVWGRDHVPCGVEMTVFLSN